MISAILYSSCTGSCEKYAKLMSEATGVPAYSVKDYKFKFPREKVAYVGWLFAGRVMGLGSARRKAKVKAVCQVGMGPDLPSLEATARKKNALPFKSVPIFYMQGAFHLDRLPLPLKLIMKLKTKDIAAGLANKAEVCRLNEQEQATLTMAQTGSGEPAAWDISKFVDWFKTSK